MNTAQRLFKLTALLAGIAILVNPEIMFEALGAAGVSTALIAVFK